MLFAGGILKYIYYRELRLRLMLSNSDILQVGGCDDVYLKMQNDI